ncbi:MAG: sulfotransferase, partial [Chloroflexota bacterium]
SATGPIFVVGTPRSGTTLLAAMLGAHPDIDCGPETRFFSWLERADRPALLDPRTWPGPATDFVLSLRLQDSPVHELFGVTPDQVRGALAARRPSMAAMLESLTVTRAAAHGKPRWAEKTPRHISSLPLIRREWPDASIIRVVRDPRDVALSLAKVPFAGESLVGHLALAARNEREAAPFLARDARSMTIRYEDLVREPRPVLEGVCAFLGVPFVPDMIDRHEGVEGIAAPHETWKAKAAEPLDPSRVSAWRRTMDPAVQRFAALHCRDLLRAHGYPDARDPARTVAFVPIGDLEAARIEGVLLALADRDTAIATPTPLTPAALERQAEIVLWGSPDQLGLQLGRRAAGRTAGIARFARLLARRRLAGRPAIWIHRHTPWPARPNDTAGRVASLLLRVFARSAKPSDLPAVLGLPDPASGMADE